MRPKKNYTLKRTPLKSKSAGLKRSPMKKQNDKYKEEWEEARKK